MQKTSPFDDELLARLAWFNHLRWLAVFGVVTVSVIAGQFFSPSLELTVLLVIAAFMAGYNLLFSLGLRHIDKWQHHYSLWLFANLQISLDLVALTILLHFAGGVENPFVFYFVFHMIIASILLGRVASYFQASLACILFMSMAFGEKYGWLTHYHLLADLSPQLYRSLPYLSGMIVVFTSTMFLCVYMSSSICQKVRSKTQDIIRLNEELHEKDRLKSRYVQHVSHDIRSHLSSIQSCITLVTRGYLGEVAPKQQEMLERATHRLDFLLRFVKTLLSLSNIRLTATINQEVIDTGELCQKVFQAMKPHADAKHLTLEIACPDTLPAVIGSSVYFEDALINLLGNAIKYTREGGQVSLSVSSAPEENSNLFCIRDTGIGIAAQDIPHVFDEFYRSDMAQKSGEEGSGLGMSITKEIIEKHHGKIWLESEIGIGTSVFVLLPITAHHRHD